MIRATIASVWLAPALVLAEPMPVTPEMIRHADGAAPAADGMDEFGGASDLQIIIAGLDSDDWKSRENAARALARHPGATDEALAELAKQPGLSLEQRRRIAGVVRDRFLESPRGAIGVEFAPAQGLDSTIIRNVRPNFPAARLQLLRPGDRIVGINGEDLISPEDVRGADQIPGLNAGALPQQNPAKKPAAIQRQRLPGETGNIAMDRLKSRIVAHRPGDVVTLTIKRPIGPPRPALQPVQLGQPANNQDIFPDAPEQEFETLNVQVPLGSYDELSPGGYDRRAIAQLAWRNREAALGLRDAASELIATSITPEDWQRLRRMSGRNQFRVDGEVRPSGAFPGRDEQFANRLANSALPRNGRKLDPADDPNAAIINIIQLAQPDAKAIERRLIDESQRDLLLRIEALDQQIMGLSQRLRLPSLPQKERQLIEAQLDAYQELLKSLMDQNAALIERKLELAPR